jgi:putative glutamine amidotransferase
MNKLTRPPVIGITTFDQNEHGHYHLASAYVDAVRSSGGLPILLPPDAEEGAAILEVVDGLIFSGGGDLDPVTYDGSLHPTISTVDPKRDTFELTLAQLALNTDIPLLGICRGIGVMSVASGGTLVPHIPEKFGEVVMHTGGPTQTVEHPVQIEPESRLASVLGATVVTVVSWHHQAVCSVPSGWRVSARTADAVIEALEHEQHPWAIALQWHPELAINDPPQQRIFQSLVEAARIRNIRNQNKSFSPTFLTL